MIKVLLTTILMILFFSQFLTDNITKEIKPLITCTKMMCYEENPCCNSCSMSGWITADNMNRVDDKLSPKKLKHYKVDGCGQIKGKKILIRATGAVNPADKVFYIIDWQEKK